MFPRFGRISVLAAFIFLFSGTAFTTFAVLENCARENENPGTQVSLQGLYRKFGNGNALFTKTTLSPDGRRAILMLSREPCSEAELFAAERRLRHFEKTLPAGNKLFLIDDSGKIFLERALMPKRKIFDLADELRILSACVKSVPVNYFPSDALRGKIYTDVWEGDLAFPVPEKKGREQ